MEKEELAVLVSGTSIMGLEILAGRVLAPEFGSSIYTWGSIIGVFMAALSLGYHVGGKRAKMEASYTALATILLQAAAFVAFLLIGSDTILSLSSALPVGARYGAIIPVLLLFGPPTFLLGFISPYSAQLSRKNSSGEASGHVFALGTIGSISGAFLTTFLLIPYLSVNVIGLLFGSLLIFGALLISFDGITKIVGYSALVMGLLITSFVVQGHGLGSGKDAVLQTQTPYQKLSVKDSDGVRTMYLNGQPQSAMYLNGSNQYVWKYTKYFHIPFLLQDPDEVENVLFIGGGGFSGPKRFAEEYDMQIDVVEIDPDVINAANTYFNASDYREIKSYNQDGREFLQKSDTQYDIIILDAYKKDSVPFHLTTEEFMQLTYDKLDEDGVLVSNIISTKNGAGSRFYRAEYKTLQQVYPTVYSFPTSKTSFTQNIELVATKQPSKLTEQELQQRNRQRSIGINLSDEITYYQRNVTTEDVPVLRDKKAPVDRLLDPLLGRKYVIEQ